MIQICNICPINQIFSVLVPHLALKSLKRRLFIGFESSRTHFIPAVYLFDPVRQAALLEDGSTYRLPYGNGISRPFGERWS
jgi:hypothetical protein